MEQRGEHIYHLTLDLLLMVLKANRQTCQIRAEVNLSLAALPSATENGTASRGRDKSICVIELSIRQGQVVSTSIRDRQGRVLAQGEPALTVSQRCGELSWVVQPAQPQQQAVRTTLPSIPEQHAGSTDGWLVQGLWSGRSPPRRIRHLTQAEVEALPRKQRQVLLLIDGKRGAHELCRILHCTPDQLAAMLDELIARRLILFPLDEEEAPLLTEDYF
jgi:hypothetical protein